MGVVNTYGVQVVFWVFFFFASSHCYVSNSVYVVKPHVLSSKAPTDIGILTFSSALDPWYIINNPFIKPGFPGQHRSTSCLSLSACAGDLSRTRTCSGRSCPCDISISFQDVTHLHPNSCSGMTAFNNKFSLSNQNGSSLIILVTLLN